MYNKTIKKSIVIIITTTLLLSCFSVLADSIVTDENFLFQVLDYSLSVDNIIDTHPDPNDPNNYYLAKYRVSVTPYIYFRNTGFINGKFYVRCNTSITNPNGSSTPVDIKIEPKSLLNDNLYTTQLWAANTNSGQFYVYGYFSNYYVNTTNAWVPIESFYIEFSLSIPVNQSSNVNLSITAGDLSDTCIYSTEPADSDLAAIITSSVIEALGDTNTTNSVIELLYSLVIDQEAANILLSNNGTTLSNLLNTLNNQYSYLVNNLTPQLLNKLDLIINKLQSLYDDIDNLIDTISWKKDIYLTQVGYSSTIDGTYTNEQIYGRDLYLKYTPSSALGNSNNIVCFDVGLYITGNHTLNKNDITVGFYTTNSDFISIDYYFIRLNYGYRFYIITPYMSQYSNLSQSFIIHIKLSNTNFGVTFYPNRFNYIGYLPDNDIEYWQILSTIYQYQLIHNGEEDTQAANELSQAANMMEQAAAAMDVSKPNIAAVIPETLLAADAAQAQGEIFSWLSNGYITSILVACFTIALIGFVLYGKSG